MGCCCCCCGGDAVLNPNIRGRDEIAVDTMKSIGLTDSDIKKLYKVFCDVDLDGSGDVRHDEFFAYFRIVNSDINQRIFEICDIDKSGVLSFCEFVLALWNLLSMNAETIASFIFYIFDDDNTGTLNFHEIRKLVETVHHKSYDTNKAVKKLVEQLRKLSSHVNVMQFIDWARQNPPICAPLISLQYRLRTEIYGEGFWEELQARRWRAGNKLAPDYIIKVNQQYIAKMEAKKRLRAMNSTIDLDQNPEQPSEKMAGRSGMETSSEQKKNAFAQRKNTSVTTESGLGEILPESPVAEAVPLTIQRTITRILDDRPGEDGQDEGAPVKKRRRKKKKKKKVLHDKPPKIMYLPPVLSMKKKTYQNKIAAVGSTSLDRFDEYT